jgi:hypothetical protein
MNPPPKTRKELESLALELEEREKELAAREAAVLQKEQTLQQMLSQVDQAGQQQIAENKILIIQKNNLIEQLRIDHTAIYKAWLRQGNRSEEAMKKKKQKLEKRIQDTLGKRSASPPREQWV